MTADVERLYRAHLTDSDLRLLDRVAPGSPLAAALAAPGLEQALFTGADAAEALARTSPFLTFAVAVHRSAARLGDAHYVEERWAPRRRVPVFDVSSLRELLGDARRRLFLVELLASYTHVSSGAVWTKTVRGWRRQRFSELDPVRLAGLLDAVGAEERPGVYRRLGDLALFLTGVFPDTAPLGAMAAARLARLSGLPGGEDPPSWFELLEMLGPRWYLSALRSARSLGVPVTDALAVVGDVGRRFGDARRALNVVTDWYLFPLRERWFGAG